MKEYISYADEKRKEMIRKSKTLLENKNDIVFAYIFGSFPNAPSFRDIDIGIYVKEIMKDDVFDYELRLADEIAAAVNVPFDIIDVRILNHAPGHFLNSIFCRGTLLFCNDQKFLSELIENTSLNALANENIAYESLKELVPN